MERSSVNKSNDMTECITQRIPFLFEEPSHKWNKLKVGEQNDLLRLGAFSTKRLAYIETIHIVYQHERQIQITLAPDLSIPHGQAYVRNQELLPSNLCKINLHSQQDMLQQDSTSIIQTILLTNTNLDIIFNQVKNTILLDNHHISKQKGLTERQQYYRDYGFSSGQSHQRKTDGMIENGIPKPSLSNNIDKEVVNVFKVVNAIIDQECPWIWPGISAERSLEFAQSIHHDNKRIEAARFAVYPFDSTEIMKTQSALCKFHVDKKNGKDSKLSQVLIFSKMIWKEYGQRGWRVALIFYTRESITQYYERKNKTYGPSLEYITTEYEKVSTWRKEIPSLILFLDKQRYVEDVFGSNYYQFPCHMCPSVHLSPIIHYTVLLVISHNLSFNEVTSCLLAWSFQQWTVYYYAEVCKSLIPARKLPKRVNVLGLYILEDMRKLHHERLESKLKHPGLRYGSYFPDTDENEEDWGILVQDLVKVCVHSLKRTNKPLAKKTCLKEYTDSYARLKKLLKNCGRLKVNHLMGVMAAIGTLPLWYCEYYAEINDNALIRFLKEHYSLPMGSDSANRLVFSMIEKMQCSTSKKLSMRDCENIFCKVYQLAKKKKTEIYSDLLFKNQSIFDINAENIIVYRLNSEIICRGSVNGSLISKWPYQGCMISTNMFVLNHERDDNVKDFSLNFEKEESLYFDAEKVKAYEHVKNLLWI